MHKNENEKMKERINMNLKQSNKYKVEYCIKNMNN